MGRLEGDEGRHGSCNHRRSPHHRCALGVVLLWMLWSTCQTQKTSRGLASTRHQHSTSSSIEYDELQPCASTSRRCSSPIRRGGDGQDMEVQTRDTRMWQLNANAKRLQQKSSRKRPNFTI